MGDFVRLSEVGKVSAAGYQPSLDVHMARCGCRITADRRTVTLSVANGCAPLGVRIESSMDHTRIVVSEHPEERVLPCSHDRGHNRTHRDESGDGRSGASIMHPPKAPVLPLVADHT